MKVNNNLDLNKHELQNFVIQNLAGAPSNPKRGTPYYNTGDDTIYVWNGTGWIDALNQSTNGITDHGGLSGLEDDDHPQYALTNGTRGSFATVAQGNLASTAVQPGDISLFENTTQLNVRDTNNRNRSNHTGTQAISTITNLQTTLNSKLDTTSIVNNLTSGGISDPLSAQQGLVLKGLIDNINTILTSDETTLDTIQEIVDFIELNKSTLDTLGISNISGLQNALNNKADSVHTHTSTQITNFATSVSTNTAVAANTLKRSYPLSDENKVQTFTTGKFSSTITGNGVLTNFSITHNLGTLAIVSDIWEVSTGEKVLVDIIKTSTNAVNVVFGTAPINNKEYLLVLIG